MTYREPGIKFYTKYALTQKLEDAFNTVLIVGAAAAVSTIEQVNIDKNRSLTYKLTRNAGRVADFKLELNGVPVTTGYSFNYKTGTITITNTQGFNDGLYTAKYSYYPIGEYIFSTPSEFFEIFTPDNPDTELAAAVVLAFANGADQVVVYAVDPFATAGKSETSPAVFTDTDYIDSITKADKEEFDALVVLSGSSSVINSAIALLESIEASSKFAVGFFGFNSSETVSSMSSKAIAISNKRAVLVGPQQFIIADTLMPSYVAAAAVAGAYVSTGINARLTRKQLNGCVPAVKLLKSEENMLAESGILVISSNGAIRHAITTDTTTAQTEELSVVKIENEIKKAIVQYLDAFIGVPLSARDLAVISNGVTSILNGFVESGALESVGNAVVKQNSNDPRYLDVLVSYKPAYPAVWIDVYLTVLV